MLTQRKVDATGVLPIACLLVSLVGCGDKREERASGAAGQREPATIAEVQVGRQVNSAHQVERPASTFVPTDTIWGSVKTENTPAGATIRARWVYTGAGEDRVVTEDTHTTARAGTGYTSFFVANPEPWPAGDYELRVTLDGADEAGEEVRKFKVEG